MDFEPGDLLLFYGRDLTSRVIEWATRGPSHVGIVCPHALSTAPNSSRNRKRNDTHKKPPEGGTTNRALLFESTTLCDVPCVLTGECRAGVQAHEPADRVAGYPGAVALLRLTPAWRLHAHEVALLHTWLMHVASEPYDLCGAIVSGTRLFKWTALMPYPDLGSLFCSELCAAALMRLQRMPLANPSLYNPASLVRELRHCGTYGPPRNLSVVSCQLSVAEPTDRSPPPTAHRPPPTAHRPPPTAH